MILFTSLNSQYVHANLAIRYLAAVTDRAGTPNQIAEFTVNEEPGSILRRIARLRPQLIAFSCYIWNISATLSLIANLKKILPDTVIMLGGPEVSYNASEIMRDHPTVDLIIRGEAEETLAEWLDAQGKTDDYSEIDGLAWRRGGTIIENRERIKPPKMDDLPDPYVHRDENDHQRILYYETSRGCPFRCGYCLSSLSKGVRYASLDKVKNELTALTTAENPPSQIKFVDRTFNCHPERTREMLDILNSLPGETSFHFEIVPELLDDSMITFFQRAPEGRYQVEIGVQSVRPETLESINRKQDRELAAEKIRQLRRNDNVHIHLDLIAGLPFDDYQSMGEAFTYTYSLEPHHLQLGFLKLLKGAPLTARIADEPEWEYQTAQGPPYEVLSNRWLPFSEISRLKTIDRLLGQYYNSGAFSYTLAALIENDYGGSSWQFYNDFAVYCEQQGLADRPHRQEKLYAVLRGFAEQAGLICTHIIEDLLAFDYILSHPTNDLPPDLNGALHPNHREMKKRNKSAVHLEELNFTDAGRLVLNRNVSPRTELFRSDVLRLAGLKETPGDRPYYPVLFKWEQGRRKAAYLPEGGRT